MAFPDTILDLRTELEIAGAWTNATSLVYQRDGNAPPVTIERGRADEMSQVNPSSSVFEVNNRGGQFSPLNPLGPWYGQLGPNTPVRHSIPAQANYLRLEALTARAFVNDTGAGSPLSISGSIEMRLQADLSDWQGGVLAAKWDFVACWVWTITAAGYLQFTWEDSGVVQHSVISSVPLPFFRGQQALRVTMDATNGNVTFSTAATIGGTFTTLGTVQSGTGGAATSIAVNHSSALVVGYSFSNLLLPNNQLYGRVYEYKLLNGIGGTVAADGIFSAQAAGATSFTDSAGNAWTCSAISDRDYRFHGEIAALPPKWDATGNDQSVQVTASGPLRRLGQGQSPVQSPLKRALASLTGTLTPVAYWAWEDGEGATALGSAIGGPLMNFDGSPKLAADSSFAGSMPLPQLSSARFYGLVPAYSGSGSIVARFLMKLGTAPGSTQSLVRLITNGTAGTIDLNVTSSGFLNFTSTGGGSFVTNLASPTGGGSWSGQQWWMSMEIRPSGGNVQATLVMLSPGSGQAFTTSTTTFAGSVGNISQVRVNRVGGFADTVMGHFSVQADWETMFNFQDPLDAWNGETAAARFARLCSENNLACRIIGSPGQSAAMGQQGTDTLPNLLQECENADRGLMGEPRQVLGLSYRTLASMCNQSPRVTCDYSQAQLGGTTGDGSTGLAPTYDDARLRNDETITRGNTGGSQGAVSQYQLDDGSLLSVGVAGDYSDSQTVNVELDSQVPNVAGWLVHVGTVNQARWPAIPFNLRRPAIWTASLYYPLLSLDTGDYQQLSNMPNVILYDPVRQLAFGLKESLGGFHHQLEVNAVPESAYEVIILDDLVYGRVDTDGCTVHASVPAGATSIQVDTIAGFPLWSTTAADYPADFNIGGERVTVTAVSGSSNPQTLTVVRAVNGVSKAQAAGTDVRLWFPPILALS